MDAASRSDVFVLTGDIFDFLWSTHVNPQATADAAIEWLEQLVARGPSCHFHYVLGNHDRVQALVDRLDGLVGNASNLSWHPFLLRLGNCVFLHGDALDVRASPAVLQEARSQHRGAVRKSRWLDAPYQAAVHLRLHRLALRLAFPTKGTVRKLTEYLESVSHGPDDGVTDVYFGHTHTPLLDFEHGGLRFHNPGSAIKGLRFHILDGNAV